MFCFICGKKNYVIPTPILSHIEKEPEPEQMNKITIINDKFVNITINDNNSDNSDNNIYDNDDKIIDKTLFVILYKIKSYRSLEKKELSFLRNLKNYDDIYEIINMYNICFQNLALILEDSNDRKK